MSSKRKHSDDAPRAGPSIDGNSTTALEDQPMAVTWPVPSADNQFKDLYLKPPDFKQLALLDPDFAAYVKGRDLDFNDPTSVMQLTKTLLKLDFDLKIELPGDRLCPPVANRHNYILWLKGLLDTSSYEPPGRKLVGLDIGTGASCIYPLLGCAQRPWSFIATGNHQLMIKSDIDEKNLEYARKNVKLNDLEARIKVVSRKPDAQLIPLDDLGIESIDFCMTNPPFYESADEMRRSASKKSRPPSTACTGSEVEMVTAGGEVGFVERILAESLVLRGRVQWYTAMLGFLSSATKLLEELKAHGIDNCAVTEFVQGSKTRRWAVAWSFGGARPAQSVARGTGSVPTRALLPPVTEVDVLSLRLPGGGVGGFASRFSGAIGGLELLSWDWDVEKFEGVGRAVGNVWNRAWRRRKKKREVESRTAGSERDTGETPGAAGFGFLVWVKVVRQDEVSIGSRWLEGHDGTIFESFQGFLKTTAQALTAGRDGETS
ncbi:Methyltransferase-like protein-like protein [Hapsidospora chrysogenum ATCC 11550]|uniref:Methyltransferase-like protein-like protein n=1 Tax=Hapsidospora chrysogenum (strain ATCC 11550 / CBS 779.69 / DSM 880 / IAM 14645 / JCM 23072 / IMI 49137) TaxID=857340 RepID=A0A086T740_HAPC1|nr:Methyltransferase-like protein-like protein [Hapsidospora chrysogenum ATCC 11550]